MFVFELVGAEKLQFTVESTSLTGNVKVFATPNIANCGGIAGIVGGSSTGVTLTLKFTVPEVVVPSKAFMLMVEEPFWLRAGFNVKVQLGAVPPITMLGDVGGRRAGFDEFVIVNAEQGRLLSMSFNRTLTIAVESSFIT